MMKSFKELSQELHVIVEAAKAPSMDDIKTMLKKHLKLKESDFKIASGKRMFVLTDSPRVPVLEQIANVLVPIGWKWNRSTKISSIGHLEDGEMVITVKPKSKQGGLSAGLADEATLTNNINSAIELNSGKLDLVFSAGSHKVIFKNIVKAVQVGGDTANRKKADMAIITDKGKTIPISIKKDNAEIWESADSYWGIEANKFIKKLVMDGKIRLDIQNAGHYKIAPQFAVKASPAEIRDIVFGSDILAGGGIVVERTFKSNDFTYMGDKNQLKIDCSTIIQNADDIPTNMEPWFLVRNDSTRNGKQIGYAGLRVLAVFESRIQKTVLRIHRNYLSK